IHPRSTLVLLDLLVRLPHQPLRDLKRLALRTRLAHSHPPTRPTQRPTRLSVATKSVDEPTPSLHPHYRSFTTTTSRSASEPCHRYSTPPVSAVDALPLPPTTPTA